MTEPIQLGATPNAFNRKASGNNTALGPLQHLVAGNQWVGDTGFNLMVVPHPTKQFLVMISPLFETHEFVAVPAPVPNRSARHGTAQVGAIKYSQIVAENVSKNILHEETGMWLNQTAGTRTEDPSGFGLQKVDAATAAEYLAPNPIMRSGTIPHGNTVHATGTSTLYAQPEDRKLEPYLALDHFPTASGELQFLPTIVDGTDAAELEDLQGAFRAQIGAALKLLGRSDLSVESFINPIGFLNPYANGLLNVTSLAVTTANGNGGVINVPFERAVAGPQDFICTFLIEEISNRAYDPDTDGGADENPTFFQLQYLQSIPLRFPKLYNGKDVVFPHWNVNTLIAI